MASTAAEILTQFEAHSAANPVDPNEPFRSDRDTDYYRRSSHQRHNALSAPEFQALIEHQAGVTNNRAKVLIREGMDLGELVRVGSSTATGYRTKALQEALDEADRRRSREQIDLGRRAESLGLKVEYALDRGYRNFPLADLPPYLERGYLVTEAKLDMDLASVVALVEQYSPAHDDR